MANPKRSCPSAQPGGWSSSGRPSSPPPSATPPRGDAKGHAAPSHSSLAPEPATTAVGATGLLTACSAGPGPRLAPASQRRRYGGTLRVGLTGGSANDTLDPHQGLNYLGTARAQALYEPLVQLSPDAQIEYVLASAMTPR